jgi:hypothetical protein
LDAYLAFTLITSRVVNTKSRASIFSLVSKQGAATGRPPPSNRSSHDPSDLV